MASSMITITRLPIRTTNKQHEQQEKEHEQEQASDLPALALQFQPQLPASSSSQTENRHKQQAASPIAKHNTITYTTHSFQKPAVQHPPPSPLRSTLSHTTTSYHRHRSINRKAPPPPESESRPYVKHLHTFALSQPLSSPNPAAVSHRSSASQAQAAAAGCTP
jgi:hypothetical protein